MPRMSKEIHLEWEGHDGVPFFAREFMEVSARQMVPQSNPGYKEKPTRTSVNGGGFLVKDISNHGGSCGWAWCVCVWGGGEDLRYWAAPKLREGGE